MRTDPDEWVTPLPLSTGDRLRALAPILLLLVVASLGIRNHIDHDQSSWEGASFGMFATYENHVSRLVVATVTDADGPTRVALPTDLADDALRLRVAPSQGAVDDLAAAVADRVRGDEVIEVEVVLWKVALAGDGDLTLRLVPSLRATLSP